MELTNEQIDDAKQAFSLFDKCGNGAFACLSPFHPSSMGRFANFRILLKTSDTWHKGPR